MQHTDKAIAEFEAWWDRQPHREQFEDLKDQMRNVWLASWAESREQLVIGLPSRSDQVYQPSGVKTWDRCRAAIEAAGVTVKS